MLCSWATRRFARLAPTAKYFLFADSRGFKTVSENGDGRQAEMTYSRAGAKLLIIDHTEVGEALRGAGAGKQLVVAAVEYARQNQLKILPLCPYAKSVFNKTEAIRDVLK